jgi:hypothetical protein
MGGVPSIIVARKMTPTESPIPIAVIAFMQVVPLP